MSANKFAGSGPIMAGLAAKYPDTFGPNSVAFAGAPVVRDHRTTARTSAYPGDLQQFELRRIIQNLADQVSELAAQNVELRARLEKLEKPQFLTWASTAYG